MRKWMPLFMALALCLLLTGCGAAPDAAQTPAPTQPPVEVPKTSAEGPLAEAVRQLMAPYTAPLEKMAKQNPGCIAHTIPGGILQQMAEAAQRLNIRAENGRWRFTDTQTAVSTYRATGLEVTSGMALETRDPGNETPMGEGGVGDLSVSGGGRYERRYDYDAAEDLTGGTVEITETLDGERTGHERFAFAVTAEGLCFVDVAAEMTVQADGLTDAGACLVTVGRVQKDSAEIIEYLMPGGDGIPSLGDENWFTVPASATLTARYRTE